MVVGCHVSQAYYGRGAGLVTSFREFKAQIREAGAAQPPFRILTDAFGLFFTMATALCTGAPRAGVRFGRPARATAVRASCPKYPRKIVFVKPCVANITHEGSVRAAAV